MPYYVNNGVVFCVDSEGQAHGVSITAETEVVERHKVVALTITAEKDAIDLPPTAIGATLDDVINKFNLAENGSVTFDKSKVLDFTQLDAAIEAANAAKKDVVESTDGTDVEPAKQWVTSEQMSTFTSAISTAEGVKSSANKQQEVDDAKSTLEAATSTFEGQKAAGTKEE